MNFVHFGSHLLQTGASKNKFWNRIPIWQINLHISKKVLKKPQNVLDSKNGNNRMKTWGKMSAFVWKLIDDGLNFQQLRSKSTNLRGKING